MAKPKIQKRTYHYINLLSESLNKSGGPIRGYLFYEISNPKSQSKNGYPLRY